MIGYSEGVALKNFLASNPDHPVTIDPKLVEAPHAAAADQMATFSSRGPTLGSGSIKPDLLAVGTEMYMATESSDPLGDLYDPTGYIVSQGTSFSTPMVAGAVALVKQAHPQFSPAQLKSALVNTAAQTVTENGSPADVTAAGGGRLDAAAAVTNGITIEPATLSFGVIGQISLPVQQALRITNTSSAPVNLAFTITPLNPSPSAQITLDSSNLTLAPAQSQVITATLSGTQPAAGLYDGRVAVQGGPVALQIPYLYSVPSGAPFDIVPLIGEGYFGTVGQLIPDGGIVFRLIDDSGLPVAGVPVQFSVTRGGGSIQNADSQTDANGIAGAEAYLGPNPGPQQFTAQAGGLTVTFDGEARLEPAIANNGVVNAASFQPGNGVAPGSYISIFGSGLSDDTQAESTPFLPLSIDNVSVSFDVPSAGLSLPGRLVFVSPSQVNVQVPWELRGQSSALLKVTIGDSLGRLATVPLADYAPAVFEYSETGTTRLAAALRADESVIGTGNPAQRGQTISLFANGLGPVDNSPATGEPAPATPLVNTLATPVVTIGGKKGRVSFSGLAPGFAALYQLNVTVPPDTPMGVQRVVVTVNGVSSPPVDLPVQ